MNTMLAIEKALSQWSSPLVDGNRITLATHCLYPSHSVVRVTVTGGVNHFVVDDGGGAFAELYAAMPAAGDVSKQLLSISKPFGLKANSRGMIYAPPVQTDELLATILLVANASRQAAEYFIEKIKPPRRNFRAAIEVILEKRFHNKWKPNRKVAGASSKLHTFDYVVTLTQNKQLVLDFVVPESSSINAALVAHMDVSNSGEHEIEQRIIYDDSQPWKASDLALLKSGSRAKVVPFSSIERNLEKLAA